jgi:hypothetical protein
VWRPAQDFHVAQGAVDTPSTGEMCPTALLQWPWAGGSTISVTDSELEIKSQLAMLGKGADPSKHCGGPE